MAVFDEDGNELTLAEMVQQISGLLATDAEHRPHVWVRPDVAERLRDYTEGHQTGYLAALGKYGPFALDDHVGLVVDPAAQ